MIEEESAAKKKKKEMERKRKEEEQIPSKEKEDDGEVDKPEEGHSPADGVGAQDVEEEASDPTDTFHPQKTVAPVFRRAVCSN